MSRPAPTTVHRSRRHSTSRQSQPQSRPLSTLLPFRGASGPMLLGARALGPRSYELSWARPAGPWCAFATLELEGTATDEPVAFDPVLHQVPGLAQYAFVVRLREPSYRWARRSRQ